MKDHHPVWLHRVSHGLPKVHGSSKLVLFVGHGLLPSSPDALVSRTFFVPVSGCRSGPVQQRSAVGTAEGQGFGEGSVSESWGAGRYHTLFFPLPLALPGLVRESSATSPFRLHQSPLQEALLHCVIHTRFWDRSVVLPIATGCMQLSQSSTEMELFSFCFCAWLLLSRFLKCAGIATYNTLVFVLFCFFIAM